MPSLWPTQPRLPEPRIAEVECPYCGVPRALDTLVWVNTQTGKVSTGPKGLDPSTASAIFLVVTAVTTSLSTVLVDGLPLWAGIGLGAALGLVVLFAITARSVKSSMGDVRAHRYHCVICGRDWTWREGTPRPRYRYREQIMEEYERLFGDRAEDTEQAEDKA